MKLEFGRSNQWGDVEVSGCEVWLRNNEDRYTVDCNGAYVEFTSSELRQIADKLDELNSNC